MNNSKPQSILWQDRGWIAAWLVPACLIYLFAHFIVPLLSGDLLAAEKEWARLRENTYEKPWLDSTENRLKEEVELLSEFYLARSVSLVETASAQVLVDRLRNLAEECGMQVLRTQPTQGKAGELQRIQVRLEGLATFPQVYVLLDKVRRDYPYLYLEEISLRASEKKMETSLHVYAYVAKEKGR